MYQIKLAVHQVAEGMYVSELDRPWTETPFPFQGFKVTNGKQIRTLNEFCRYVYIDAEKGAVPAARTCSDAPAVPADIPPAKLPEPSFHYRNETTVEDELEVAAEIHGALISAIGSFMESIRANERPRLEVLSSIVSKMRDSILRNPNAFLWLSRLKSKDSYSYSHCIQCGSLAMAFARQLGLPPDQIHDLSMGALLLDVGKLKLPQNLLGKKGPLTPGEYAVAQKHVEFSVAAIEKTESISSSTVVMVATHHERFDGSGYPKGLKGGDIPLFGRMAGIVDFFTAVTNERPYAPAMAPPDAIMHLYGLRNTLFQSELIEHFIQTIGVYPVGTLIELSSGEVGIIVAQNEVRRLRPKVLIVLDSDKHPLGISPIRDLISETEDDAGNELNILHSLKPGMYGIDPEEYYL